MDKIINMIGMGLGLGTPKVTTGQGPDFFANSEFGLKSLTNIPYHWQSIDIDNHDANLAGGKDALPFIKKYCESLAETVAQSLVDNKFPCVIGGDHSIAIGTWSGVTAQLDLQQEFGLIWVDAHMDSHTFETTPSQAIHGMPLASLLGYGDSSLVNLVKSGAKLLPEHVVMIGVRSFEEGEKELLNRLNVRVILQDEVKERGFQSCFQEALNIVRQGTKGFGVSIDLDAFDPLYAPGVGTPEVDGINPEDVFGCLPQLKNFSDFQALEIVEFNPPFDKADRTVKLLSQLIKNICS